MTRIACRTCGQGYDGAQHAWCPPCLARHWRETPQLLRDKHDPDAPPAGHDSYRSILTPRAKRDLAALLEAAARDGRWYFDRDYRMWVHVTFEPLGRAPGVGIPAGREEAQHALSCLFIAEADSDSGAHVFAADLERHEAQIRAGVFEPLGACDEPSCQNLARPGSSRCGACADR